MASWITSIFSSGAAKVVDSVGEAVDKLVTSDQEKLELRNELEKVKLQAALDAQKQADEVDTKYEEEYTKRWQADTSSDEPIAKKARPYALLGTLVFTGCLIVVDSFVGFGFDVKDAYVSLTESLLLTIVVAYFGSRGLEKWQKIKK